MEKRISLMGSYASDWLRYSDYVYEEAPSGELYLLPADDSIFSMYNPFDVAEDILLDLLVLGDRAAQLSLKKEEEEEELKKIVLLFVKKYGLLGFISASVYNRAIIGEEILLLMDNNYVTEKKSMDGAQYLQLFMPFAKENDVIIKEHKNTFDIVKNEDSPKYYGKRPLVMDLIFSRFYSEQLCWIVEYAKMLSLHFDQLLQYRESAPYLTESVTILSQKFRVEKIGFTINQLHKTNIAWEFDSLKTTIEMIYGFAVADEKSFMGRCRHCNHVFIASNPRVKYCSPSCRNCYHVKKSRRKRVEGLNNL